MKKIKYLIILSVTLILASCGTTTKDKGIMPSYHDFRIWKENLVAVGETEVEVEFSTYLGLFYKIQSVNGKEYDSTNKNLARVDSRMVRGMSRHMRIATSKVVEKYPEAVYFQVVKVHKERTKLFLGNEVKETAVIRAYKMK